MEGCVVLPYFVVMFAETQMVTNAKIPGREKLNFKLYLPVVLLRDPILVASGASLALGRSRVAVVVPPSLDARCAHVPVVVSLSLDGWGTTTWVAMKMTGEPASALPDEAIVGTL